jgi:hypothetical protein
MWNAMNTGSTNDWTVWHNCRLKQLIADEHQLPPQFYLIGDDAFSCTNHLLVPWGGYGIGVAKDAYNFHLSVSRQVIERSFGILTKRWGLFWRPLARTF